MYKNSFLFVVPPSSFLNKTDSAINSEVWRSPKHYTAGQTYLHNYCASRRFCNKQYIQTRRCASIYSTLWRPLWLSLYINDITLILAHNRNKNTSLIFNPQSLHARNTIIKQHISGILDIMQSHQRLAVLCFWYYPTL